MNNKSQVMKEISDWIRKYCDKENLITPKEFKKKMAYYRFRKESTRKLLVDLEREGLIEWSYFNHIKIK